MKKRNKATIAKLLEHFKTGLDLDRLAALGEKAILFVADQVRRRGLRAVLDDVRDFGGILRDGAAGRFPVSRAILLQIGAALGYLFFPTDLVPDMIPVVGLGDDAAVSAMWRTASRQRSLPTENGGVWWREESVLGFCEALQRSLARELVGLGTTFLVRVVDEEKMKANCRIKWLRHLRRELRFAKIL